MLCPTPRQTWLTQGALPVADLDLGVTYRLEPDASWAAALGVEQRPEAYRLEITAAGATVTALEPEGFLRAQATLRQLWRDGELPIGLITDWPEFRYRCASDWLINVECNRWSYDWGDGPEATLGRIQRKLDFCADHKINQVWFEGFGWSLERFPGYPEFIRQCSRYARERGIKLTFAGYGGGYGTSYQKSELYRCGYQGQTFLNRRPWPDGEVYDCCGMGNVPESRQYGTCLSNAGLKAAKLDEMARFVSGVEPGFMYIHDIDAGTFAEAHQGWLNRCPQCRERWPSDEMIAADGQAGAYAVWFGQVCDCLHGLTVADGDYSAARDLTLIFTGPVYGTYYEPAGTWDREVEYFRLLSELLGPRANVQFGFREQFLRADGTPCIRQLRQALDEVGHGHGIHVIAFGGGDHYLSNDLVNGNVLLAHLYEGAQSVCVSNGGVHEEPVQMLNAECLWHGSAAGFRPELPGDHDLRPLWQEITQGTYRPEAVYGPGGFLERACRALWGDEAGKSMWRAYTVAGATGRHPVSRVWWAVTREVRRLHGDNAHGAVPWETLVADWEQRVSHTRGMLAEVREARQALPADTDLAWLEECLEVGGRFGQVILLAAQRRVSDSGELRDQLAATLGDLRAYLAQRPRIQPTEPLGGDPGCWDDTLEHLWALSESLDTG